MKQNLYIYSGTRGVVEGNEYASLYAMPDEVLNKPDTVGQPPAKMNCAKEVIDSIRGHVPGMFEVDAVIQTGSGTKAGIYIKSAVKSSKNV